MAEGKYPERFTPAWWAARNDAINAMFPRGLSAQSRASLDLAAYGGDESQIGYEEARVESLRVSGWARLESRA